MKKKQTKFIILLISALFMLPLATILSISHISYVASFSATTINSYMTKENAIIVSVVTTVVAVLSLCALVYAIIKIIKINKSNRLSHEVI